jgi:hypothetical protein
MTKFRVCIAGRNHERFTEKCLTSVLSQEGDFTIDWTDDASFTPEAYVLARQLLGDNPYHDFRRIPERRGGLANLRASIMRTDDDAVDVLLGGDDELKPGAFARIAKEYEDPECWCTYGQLENTEGPEHYRAYEWVKGSDPRDQQFLWAPFTVRAKLAKKVLEEDLQMNGSFFMSSGDVALNIPIIEMAGHDRTRWIPDAWYTRRLHAGNDHNVDGRFQDFCAWMALCKPRYARLTSIDDAPIRTPHLLRNSIIFTPQHGRGHYVAY